MKGGARKVGSWAARAADLALPGADDGAGGIHSGGDGVLIGGRLAGAGVALALAEVVGVAGGQEAAVDLEAAAGQGGGRGG